MPVKTWFSSPWTQYKQLFLSKTFLCKHLLLSETFPLLTCSAFIFHLRLKSLYTVGSGLFFLTCPLHVFPEDISVNISLQISPAHSSLITHHNFIWVSLVILAYFSVEEWVFWNCSYRLLGLSESFFFNDYLFFRLFCLKLELSPPLQRLLESHLLKSASKQPDKQLLLTSATVSAYETSSFFIPSLPVLVVM